MAYIIQTASEKMPGRCSGSYRKVAILEVLDGVDKVSMISDRAKGVIRIVARWDRLSVGKTDRCAYRRALAQAEDMLARLNAKA